jgi:hypothetical protein
MAMLHLIALEFHAPTLKSMAKVKASATARFINFLH